LLKGYKGCKGYKGYRGCKDRQCLGLRAAKGSQGQPRAAKGSPRAAKRGTQEGVGPSQRIRL
jgi:hypothetical protein